MIVMLFPFLCHKTKGALKKTICYNKQYKYKINNIKFLGGYDG